jgi:hypothetical protein
MDSSPRAIRTCQGQQLHLAGRSMRCNDVGPHTICASGRPMSHGPPRSSRHRAEYHWRTCRSRGTLRIRCQHKFPAMSCFGSMRMTCSTDTSSRSRAAVMRDWERALTVASR